MDYRIFGVLQSTGVVILNHAPIPLSLAGEPLLVGLRALTVWAQESQMAFLLPCMTR